MLVIDCDTCKEEVTVNMYMGRPFLVSYREGFDNKILWLARVKGRTICPKCGAEIEKLFESEISPSDLMDLALRRERHV